MRPSQNAQQQWIWTIKKVVLRLIPIPRSDQRQRKPKESRAKMRHRIGTSWTWWRTRS
jgi:hypothetical protein